MFFFRSKVYKNGDIIPAKRYMLAVSKDLRYLYLGNDNEVLLKRENDKYLISVLNSINSTLVESVERKNINRKMISIINQENDFLKSQCLATISKCFNIFLELGATEEYIKDFINKNNLANMFLEEDLDFDDEKNERKLKAKKVQYELNYYSLKSNLDKQNKTVSNDEFYNNFIRTLFVLKKNLGVNFNENEISINEYLILINTFKDGK